MKGDIVYVLRKTLFVIYFFQWSASQMIKSEIVQKMEPSETLTIMNYSNKQTTINLQTIKDNKQKSLLF